MNIPTPTHSPAAEEQAALWAAKIDGSSLSGTDHAALEAWLAEHSANRTLLSQYCQFSADLEEQLPALVAAGRVTLPPERRPSRAHFSWFAGVAFAAAAAVAVGVWVNPPRGHAETYVTAVGQRQSLTLADGTRMELNAHTSVLIENGPKERRVRLASGEAFFTVSKDPGRPFIVETPAGSVRVTGTVFNVRSEAASQLEVTVVEGSVDVHTGQTAGAGAVPVALRAGGRGVLDGKGAVLVTTLSRIDVENAVAWRQGQIVFVDVPLSEAVARFARYHGRAVRAVGPAASLLVGGTYSLDDFDGFFAALPRIYRESGLEVNRELSGALVISLPGGR